MDWSISRLCIKAGRHGDGTSFISSSLAVVIIMYSSAGYVFETLHLSTFHYVADRRLF